MKNDSRPLRCVRLIREVLRPTGRGPGNGQYALQRLLRHRIEEGLDWLVLGGPPREGELPWFWCWEDRAAAVRWAGRGEPFVQGPNTLFLQSKRPRIDALESALLDAASCRMMFTESAWYRELILRHRGPANRAPVVLWPYPIDPLPPGPDPRPCHDLLIYLKNGNFPGLCEELRARFRSSRVIRYGGYRREDLWQVARHSRSCAYLADDDRGPLALAEILLCGCPTAGVPTGAPFVEPGQSGFFVEPTTPAGWIEAIRRCQELDRREVARRSAARFDAAGIVDTVLAALGDARRLE